MKVIKYFGCTVILLIVLGVLFVLYAPVFGGSQSTESLQRINLSKNFVEDRFVNQLVTSVSTRSPSTEASIMDWAFQEEDKNPSAGNNRNLFDINYY